MVSVPSDREPRSASVANRGLPTKATSSFVGEKFVIGSLLKKKSMFAAASVGPDDGRAFFQRDLSLSHARHAVSFSSAVAAAAKVARGGGGA